METHVTHPLSRAGRPGSQRRPVLKPWEAGTECDSGGVLAGLGTERIHGKYRL
jgi:hypothetical protein